MSSVIRNEGGDSSLYHHLQVPNGRSMTNGQARALTRLATAGKNDSVKSTYSLSVFLDPDASKDMVRHEELWYPMEDPGSSSIAGNQGLDGMNMAQRTAALSSTAAAGSRNLEDRVMLTQEQSTFASNQATSYQGQNEGLMRNGSRSSTSSSVAARSAHRDHRSGNESGSDMESHFNRNTVVLGVQPGEGGRGGGDELVGRGGGGEMGRGGERGRESGGESGGERRVGTEVRAGTGTAEELAHGGVRRWSTEGNLPRASEGHDTDDDEYGEEEVEQEEVLQVRSQIGVLSKASPHGRGNSSDSAADEDEEALGYISARTAERSEFRNGHNASGSAIDENGDGYNSDTRARQTLKTSDSSTEEEDEDEVDAGGYQMETQERKSFGEKIRGASSGSTSAASDDKTGEKYSSTIQPRTSIGQSRSRAEPTSSTDYSRFANAVNYDGPMKRTVQGRDAADDEDLTLTEGSDDDEQTGNSSYNRQTIHGRPKLSRTMQVDGGDSRGTDSHGYQNGVSEVRYSAPRNSSAAVHSEGEMSRGYQQRRYESGPGRQGIRRAPATQSEGEMGRVGIPRGSSSQAYGGRSNIGGGRQEASSDDDVNNWNASDGGTLNRRNDPNTSTYNDGRRSEEGSHSEGEPDDLRQDGRQPTPVIRVTTPSSASLTGPRRASQQSTSDEDAARMNVRSNPPQPGSSTTRGRDPASSNGVRNAPSASQSLTSEEEETSFLRNRQGLVSNATRPRDAGGVPYQPHPAERKKCVAADSMSSNGYSSPREPYPANNYFPRAANARGGGIGSSDTDSVDYHQSHRTNGNAPTRRVYRDHRGQSTEGQPRSGAPSHDRYNGSSHPSNHNSRPSANHNDRPSANHNNRPSANQTTTSYSDESDDDDYNDSRSHQQFVLDFPSEAEDLGGTGRSTRKTTTVKKTTTTPVTGVVRLTPEPTSSSGGVVRKTATKTVKTTPVIGIVSIPEAEPIQRTHPVVSLPPQRNRTPVVGLISVSRSPSPERTKTPVVGLITVSPPTNMHSQSMTTTTRTHQPVSGMISVSTNSNQMVRGRSITPAAQLYPDVNNNINAYPGKFRTGLASSGSFIETLAVPIETDTQSEIVGVDPELRRAQKTGSNQYRITMNLRPVVSDSSEVGYEVYDTAFGRATPVAMDRLRMNGSTAASDWRYLEGGGAEESYFRPSSVPLRSRQSSIRAPNSQRGFVTRRNGNEGSIISKVDSVSYPTNPQGRIVSPAASRQIYNIPRGSSVGMTDGSRSLSRQGPQYLRDTLLQVPTIRQTVTSRPLRQPSDAELHGYNQGYLGGGGRSRQNRLSSAMSSVFMSPTMERRYNVAATNGPSSFRDDSFSYRGGRFN